MSEDHDAVPLGEERAAKQGREEVRAAEDADHISSRDHLREELQGDVEAFLAAGGQINHIPSNVTADPPRKPQSNYGGQPI